MSKKLGKHKIDESWYQHSPGVPEGFAAGGVIVRWEGYHLLVALVEGEGLPDYILPKGMVEPGEELEKAARREIEEEAGLTELILLGELGIRERLDYLKRSWKKTHYFLYCTRQREAAPTDPDHAYSCKWFPIDRLPPMFWPEQRDLIQSSRERISSLALRFRSG